MRIASVPPSLQLPSPHPYPRHATVGVSVEHHFGRYAAEHDLDTDWIYLPIYWTANYVATEFKAQETTQGVIDGLSPVERYFTIVQADDGVYETLPNNVLVFGAGGTGDVPIPLLCDPHQIPNCNRSKRYLASFVGHVECGGPEAPELLHSSWDIDGAGARVRRAMMTAFSGNPSCHLVDQQGGTFDDAECFRLYAALSVFSLAPRGYGKTSFRLYEVMGLGSIPVYIYDESWLPYQDVIDWAEFCVLCPAGEIWTLPERLRQTTSEWRENARATIARLLPDYFTKDGMCRQIFRMIEERT